MRSKNLKSLATLGVAGVAAVLAAGPVISLPIVGYNDQVYAAPPPTDFPPGVTAYTPAEGWTVFEDNLVSAAQPYNKLAVLRATIQAVDSQIPNWPTWYKISQTMADLNNSELHDQALATLREAVLIIRPELSAETVQQATEAEVTTWITRNTMYDQYGIADFSRYDKAPNLLEKYQQALNDVANASLLSDLALTNSYVNLMVSAYEYGNTRLIINYSILPLVGEDANNPGNEGGGKPSTPEEIVEDAKDSISGLNKLAALKAAIAAVDEQIPDWNVWKYVPYAIEQVKWATNPVSNNGDEIYAKNPWITGIGSIGNNKLWLVYSIFDIEVSMDDPAIDEATLPEQAKALLNGPLADVIAAAKNSPKYGKDEQFTTYADKVSQIYDYGMATLREAVMTVSPTTTNVEQLTAEELISILQSQPEYELYGLPNYETDSPASGLYEAYVAAMGVATGSVKYDIPDTYANLVLAATQVNPDFSVNLGTVPVLTPNTGLAGDSELSGTIAKIAVASVGAIAAIAGIAITTKRYAFSPLKRRK